MAPELCRVSRGESTIIAIVEGGKANKGAASVNERWYRKKGQTTATASKTMVVGRETRRQHAPKEGEKVDRVTGTRARTGSEPRLDLAGARPKAE